MENKELALEEKEKMGTGNIWGILGQIALWALKHTGEIVGAVNNVAAIGSGKKEQEAHAVIDEHLLQLGEAAIELNEKIDTEISQVRTETEERRQQINTLTMRFEAYQRATRTTLTIMGAALSAAIIAVTVLAIIL